MYTTGKLLTKLKSRSVGLKYTLVVVIINFDKLDSKRLLMF